MGFFDNLSAAGQGSANATRREAERLRAVAEAQQFAANSVMQRGQQALQAGRFTGGAMPVSTADIITGLQTPGVSPIGGEVTDRAVLQPPAPPTPISPYGIGADRIPATTPNQVGLKPPSAAPAPAPAQTGTFDRNSIPIPPTFHSDWDEQVRREAYFGTPEGAAVLEKAMKDAGGSPQESQSEFSQFRQGIIGNAEVERELANIRNELINTSDPFRVAGIVNWFTGSPEKGAALNELKLAAGWVTTPAAVEFFASNPAQIAEFKKDPIGFYRAYKDQVGAAPAGVTPPSQGTEAATAAGAPATATDPTAAAGLDTTGNVDGNAGVKPPAEVPTNWPSDFNPANRAAMTPEIATFKNQELMRIRESITADYNQRINAARQAAAAADAERTRKYQYILAQAQVASGAGNTAYAEQLIQQADNILNDAQNSRNQLSDTMITLQSEANAKYLENEAGIWSHNAVVAEQEFARGNNPSRMLTILEAYGLPTNLVDAGGGNFYVTHPAADGGVVYEMDGNSPRVFSRGDISDYFLSTVSEDYNAKMAEAAAEQAKAAQERQGKMDEIMMQSYARMQEALQKYNLEAGDFEKIEPQDDGSFVAYPKRRGEPIIVMTPTKNPDGTTSYTPTQIST